VSKSPASQVNPAPFPTRRSYFALALAFIAFAVYGSLLPFDLQPVPLASAWDQFRATVIASPSRISRSDVLANVLLFVPIGFALAGSLLVDRTRRLATLGAIVAILPVSLAVSALAEFLQTFTVGRVPSHLDIAAQTVGCLLGIAVWAVTGSGLTRWLRDSFAATGQDRLSRVLAAFAAGWLFMNLAPFDITVDVGDLARRVRDGKITLVLFSDSGVTGARRIWDALAETISAVPLGVLGIVGFNRRRHRPPPAAFAFGTTLVVLVEMAQVFIRSHAADVTDAIFGSLGVGLGVWIGTRTLPRASAALAVPPSRVVSWHAATVFGVWCLVLCLYHWLPYDFGFDQDAIRRKLARVSLLPFAGYRASSYLNAFNDLLVKIALSVPLGVSAAFVFRGRGVARGVITIAWLLLAAGIFGAIETGQLFLPTRVPDPTDVLVGVMGAYIGLSLARWLQGGEIEPHERRS
jgi:glycopeptide antibiotics resistance protein